MLFCIDTDAGVGYKVQPCSLIILDHGKAEFCDLGVNPLA